MLEDWIREDYFLKFDVSRTTLLPLRELEHHLPLYVKKGETVTSDYAPRLFTKSKLEKFGILDDYELYQVSCDKT